MVITTGALLGAAAVKALSAGMGAYKRRQGVEAQNDFIEWAKANNRSRFYYDPTTGERALLKTAKQDRQDTNDAINNMLVAGGATTENALAARKASNERFDKFQNQLLSANQARRDRLDDQLVGLNQQQANLRANNYMQAAQDWNQWGNQTASAILSYGSTGLLDGAGAAAGAGAGAATSLPNATSAVAPAAMGVASEIPFQFAPLAPPRKEEALGGLGNGYYTTA